MRKKEDAAYIRLSKGVPGETSTERQEQAIRAYLGGEEVAVYRDLDLSAYDPKVSRPAYERLIADARAGKLDRVVVWKIDRLARSLREFVRVVDVLEAHGVALLSVTEHLDTSSPMGRAMLQIIGVFAELESATISLRTRNAKAYARARGLRAGGGPRPIGYSDAMLREVVPDEAETLRKALERYLAGDALSEIARDWNARGITRPNSSAPWSAAHVGQTLRRPHLAGLTATGEPGAWEAIFTPEEHRAALEHLGRRAPRKTDRHLLSGLLRCSGCGGRMTSKTFAVDGARRYACRAHACARRTVIRADETEAIVERVILTALESPETRAALAGHDAAEEIARLSAEVEEDRAALEQASRDHYLERITTRPEFLAARGGLEERLRATESRLAALRTDGAGIGRETDVRTLWRRSEAPERRLILDALLERITVGPAVRGRNRFDPNRLPPEAFVWRV